MPALRSRLAAIAALCVAGCAAAQTAPDPIDARLSLLPVRFQLDPPAQPEPADKPVPAADPTHSSETPPPPTTFSLFGAPDSDWLTLSTGIAKDFDESTDFNLSLAWSRFIVRDFELGVDAGLWYFDQEKDAAIGLNATPFMRWHFLARESWSLFTDAGIGLCLSSDDVPDSGTSFTFTPRAGVGATFRIADNGTRLEVGARWQHFSNARITGDQANPGRDEPMLYVGIIFPF